MTVKKILFPLLDSNRGGNILSALSICKNINKKKYKAYILLIYDKEKKEKKNLKLFKNSNINNINFLTISYNKKKFYSKIVFFYKLICFFSSRSFDIVHTNDGLLNFSFSIINLLYNFKLVIHLRNTDNSRRNFLTYAIARKIICISNFVKIKTLASFSYKKIVLYNYIDFFNKKIKLKKNHKKFINKNKNKKIILFVSNIHHRKKPEVFVEVLEKLVKKDKNFIGLMFFQSNKTDLNKFKKYLRNKNINKKIHLFHNLPAHYWMPFIKKFKKIIMLATSKNEPLGRNLVEASLNKIFVIANNSGGHKEIITKNSGILFNTNNVNKTAKIINYTFSHNHDGRVKKINLNLVKKKFQDKKYFKKIENIYANI
tara:strand:- start:36 stop:1148 length:1113 start_codon:yes stop_codon:yes gene_type:complete